MPDALMGSRVAEVADAFPERAAQMGLTQDQNVIRALSTQAAQEAFADGAYHWYVGPGRSVGRAQCLYTCSDPCEGRAVPGIVVADEVLLFLAKRSCVAEFLRNPGIGRTPGHGIGYDVP